MAEENLVDASRPSAGRIYDYILGGHHNFEVDRQAAEGLIKLIPFLREGARLQRWCLQDLAIELAEKRKFDIIIDFASGLPTNDHIHHMVPKGTVVIYSDYDPVVVEYAKDIIKDTPDVYYFQGDARRPEELLGDPTVKNILRGKKDVAIVLWGVSSFLSDAELTHTAKYLYDWSGPKSCIAFNAQNAGTRVEDPAVAQALQVYKSMGTSIYMRSLDEYKELLKPWVTDGKGFISLLEWHGYDPTQLDEDTKQRSGGGGGNFGAYLVK